MTAFLPTFDFWKSGQRAFLLQKLQKSRGEVGQKVDIFTQKVGKLPTLPTLCPLLEGKSGQNKPLIFCQKDAILGVFSPF